MTKFSKQFTARAFGLHYDRPSDFYLSSWQASESPIPMLIVRLILAAISVAILCWSVVNAPNVYWLIYLTNWGLVLVNLMTLSGLTTSLIASCGCIKEGRGGRGGRGERCGWYLRLHWLLYTIAVPIAFLITLLYWLLIYEYNESQVPAELWLDVMTHAVNSALVACELAASRVPTRPQHFYWPLAVGLWYLGFSVVYYLAGGSDALGNPYVYAVLDWREPGATGGVVALAAGALVALHLLAALLAALRKRLSRCSHYTSQDLPSAPPHEPPPHEPPEARIV